MISHSLQPIIAQRASKLHPDESVNRVSRGDVLSNPDAESPRQWIRNRRNIHSLSYLMK